MSICEYVKPVGWVRSIWKVPDTNWSDGAMARPLRIEYTGKANEMSKLSQF